MSLVYVTRKEHFNAAHKLWLEKWDDEKNNSVFGKCANPNWHGHNYTLFVTVKGKPDFETGFLIDLKLLSQIIKENIIDVLDHKNLNLDVPFMTGKMSSTEVLTIEIWNILQPLIDSDVVKLHSVKLYETENNFVEYLGE
jgi:6-pyruvoyltetrahydropterin/6-carboxytetrahydropterin synthase